MSAVSFTAAFSESLPHTPANAVTAGVGRLSDARGGTRVRKRLRRPGASTGGDPRWAASDDPGHGNFWRREADVYRDAGVRDSLDGTGLNLAAAQVDVDADGATLLLEDVSGTPGEQFTLQDHGALAAGLGRCWQAQAQAQGPWRAPWASRGFLRSYSTSRGAPMGLVENDAAWAQPLVADLWPRGLRAGWSRLLAHRELLLTAMEALPRTRCHLDAWVLNEVRRPTGEVVLLDWAFAGDGAIGEDVGNHVPDAALDLFWPAERLGELDAACTGAYLEGLRERAWTGDADLVRLGITASAVKYAWLLPLMLARAGDLEHRADQRPADAEHLYAQRGLALAHLVGWCDESREPPRAADRLTPPWP